MINSWPVEIVHWFHTLGRVNLIVIQERLGGHILGSDVKAIFIVLYIGFRGENHLHSSTYVKKKTEKRKKNAGLCMLNKMDIWERLSRKM